MNAPRIGSLRLRVLAGSFLVVSAWSEAAPPTYHEQVAPILQEHCTPCHRPGQPGPFPLQTYSEARKHALDIVEVTARRLMPPVRPSPERIPSLGSDVWAPPISGRSRTGWNPECRRGILEEPRAAHVALGLAIGAARSDPEARSPL